MIVSYSIYIYSTNKRTHTSTLSFQIYSNSTAYLTYTPKHHSHTHIHHTHILSTRPGILASFSANRWVDEKDFEISGDTKAAGSPKKARVSVQEKKVCLHLLVLFCMCCIMYMLFYVDIHSYLHLPTTHTCTGGPVVPRPHVLLPRSFRCCLGE